MHHPALRRLAGLGLLLTAALAVAAFAGRSFSDAAADQSAAAEPGELPLHSNPLRTAAGPQPRTAPARPDSPTVPAAPAVETKPAPRAETKPAAAKGPAAGGPKKLTKGKHSGVPFDPLKENGPIFEGWGKPRVALVFSGRQDGYLEPCGCAGLDRMKGGLGRRHTLFEQLRAKGWPVVALDVGGLIKGYGQQTLLKFQVTVEALRKMRYDAVALGKSDLRLPVQDLAAFVAGAGDKESMFLSANVGLFGFDSKVAPRKRVIEAGGLKIGVTAFLGKKHQKEINDPDVEMADPEKAVGEALAELKKENCHLLVLLAHATMEESQEMVKKFPDFAIVATSGGAPEPPREKPEIVGQHTRLIEVGEKGMNVIVLGLFDADGGLEVKYQRVPLDSRFAQSADMKALMRTYQDQIKALGYAGLNVRAAPNPRLEAQGTFVGSKKCESCHEPSYAVWKKTGHARAYETLVKADPPRNFDPECVSCHVVGWHPTQFFPYQGGFVSKEKTPHLIDVGCESCHGPGEKHCDAELSGGEALKEKFRKAMVVTKAESEKHLCYECHDLDNSPDFDFSEYWPIVEHYESEK